MCCDSDVVVQLDRPYHQTQNTGVFLRVASTFTTPDTAFTGEARATVGLAERIPVQETVKDIV